MGTVAQAATIQIGYKRTESYFYCYDGFGQPPVTCKLGGAIRITPDMYKHYLGAKIVGIRMGWSNPDHSSVGTIFLRHNLTDKTDVLSGKGTFRYKALAGMSYMSDYTTVNFDNPDGLTLTEELDTFYVGYYANKVPAGEYALATSYPAGQAGSAYIWGDIEGQNYDANGNEIWNDMCAASALCLDLIVEGEFGNNVLISEFITYPSMIQGEVDEALATFDNKGSDAILKLTLKYDCRGESREEEMVFTDPIQPSSSKTAVIPAYAMGTGKNTVTITAIDGEPVEEGTPFTFRTVAIPAKVAREYERTSLVEFFQSENSYYVPRYYEELIMPGFEPYADSLIMVAQHVNDQWMTGDDEETQLMVDMADGNRGVINIPAMSVDRSPNIQLFAKRVDRFAPFHGVIYPMFAPLMYEVALARPTYVSIAAACEVKGDKLAVTLSGDIAEGITGEPLYVTAYLLEDSVYTDSQEQSELEVGEYYHDNLQRARLTALWGDPIPTTSGSFEMTYDVELYPDEWKLEDMRIVAFVNRGVSGNDLWNRNILNATACDVVEKGASIDTPVAPRRTGHFYDLTGRRVLAPQPGHLYILDGKKVWF